MSLAFINFIDTAAMQALSRTFMHSLWQGILAAVLAGGVLLLTRRSSARLRYNLLLAIFFAYLCVTVITLLSQLPARSAHTATPGFVNSITITVYASTENQVTPATTLADAASRFFDRHATWLISVWLLVFLYKCSRMAVGLQGISKLRRRQNLVPDAGWIERFERLKQFAGIHQTVQLLESALVKVPVAIGFLKPVVLLPLGFFTHLTPEQAETILLHELAHIRRQDYLVNLLQNIAECVFFFNPALVWISALLREEREACCDDVVMSYSGDKQTYVRALMSFQEFSLRSELAMGIGGKKMFLLQRIKRMVAGENKKLNGAEKLLLIIGLFTITAFTMVIPGDNATKLSSQLPATQGSQLTAGLVKLAAHNLMDTLPPRLAAPPRVQMKKISIDYSEQGLRVLSSDDQGNRYEVIDQNEQPRFYINRKRKPLAELAQYGKIHQAYRMAKRTLPVQAVQARTESGKTIAAKPQLFDHKPTSLFSPARQAQIKRDQARLREALRKENEAIRIKNAKTREQLKIDKGLTKAAKEAPKGQGTSEQSQSFEQKMEYSAEAKMDVDGKSALGDKTPVKPDGFKPRRPSVPKEPTVNNTNDDERLQSIVRVLIEEDVIRDASDVKHLYLDNRQLIVNHRLQPVALHLSLKTKFNLNEKFTMSIETNNIRSTLFRRSSNKD